MLRPRANRQSKKPRISLRLLLTLPLVVQMSVLVTVVGTLSYRYGQRTIETMVYALMDQVGQQVTQELDHYLQSAHQFNQVQVAAIAAQAINPQDLDHLHRYLIGQHHQAEGLTTLLFGTPQGDFRLSHRVSPEDYGVNTQLQPEEIPLEVGLSDTVDPSLNHLYGVNEANEIGRYLMTIEQMDVRDRPWYRQAVATGQPGWIGPYQLGSTNLITLNAHRPVYSDNGDLLGVFAVNIALNQLGTFLGNLEVGQTGEVIIIDRNGLVIATSTGDETYVLTDVFDTPVQRSPQAAAPDQLAFERLQLTDLPSSALRQAYEYLNQNIPGWDRLESPLAERTLGVGPHYFITIAPYRDAYGLDWLVMTVIPEADFTASIQQNLINTLRLCLLALGGAIVSGMVISKRVTRHITQLTEASAALATGDLTQQVPATSTVVETQALALAFNQMADQLRQSFQNQVAAEATRQSEDRFQRLAAAVPGMIYTYILRPNGTDAFEYVSSASEQILEITPAQLLADTQTALSQIHPDDRPAYDAAFTRSITTLEPFSLCFRNITPSGQMKWLEANSQPLKRQDGSIAWHGLLLDVSTRAQFEADLEINSQKLAASEARFQKMAATLPGVLYISIGQPDGLNQFIYGSPTMAEVFEVEVEAAIADANTIFNLYHPEDQPGLMAALNQSVANNQPLQHEWRIITPSGKTKWLQVNARHEHLPNQDILWFGVVLDISNLKQAELELQQQKDLRETIYNEASDALFLLDSETLLITDCNQRTVELFEVKNKAVLIGTKGHHLHRQPLTEAELAQIVANIEKYGLWSQEVEYLTAKGRPIWGNLALKKVRIGDQVILLARVTDISDRKRTEAALQQANSQLEARLQDLSQRNQDMVQLGNMNDFLQACLTPEEAYSILPDLMQLLFPNCSGGVFTLSAPSNQLKAQALWGQSLPLKIEFDLADCWALRRGREHWVPPSKSHQFCRHATPEPGAATLCIPMLAQGEISGLLYLYTTDPAYLPQAKQQLANTVAEQVALAIANLQLRATLREQSIRDSLTGLFNRRHLETTIPQILRRAQRHPHPIGIIMLEADHFKGFNDTYGHDFGDQVLQSIAQVLIAEIRSSDLACRYGGEEFTLILPQSSLAETRARGETLCQQIRQLRLRHQGQPGPQITASLGVACFPQHGLTSDKLLQKANQALSEAKAQGHDRVICAPLEPEQPEPELVDCHDA